ncbi:MAG: hypothetical protein D3922_02265, partial [Candidatus Electrothrix sp. AR1]|nr:hypothetical protein [Candidatus Electrothrix sp. AR1]
ITGRQMFEIEDWVKPEKGGNGIYTKLLPIKWHFRIFGYIHVESEYKEKAVVNDKIKNGWIFINPLHEASVRKVLLNPASFKVRIESATAIDRKTFKHTEISVDFRVNMPDEIVRNPELVGKLEDETKSLFIEIVEECQDAYDLNIGKTEIIIREKLDRIFNCETKILEFKNVSIDSGKILDIDPKKAETKYTISKNEKDDEHNRNVEIEKIKAATTLGINSMNTSSSPDPGIINYIESLVKPGCLSTATKKTGSRYNYEYKKLQKLKELGNIKDFRYEPSSDKGFYSVLVSIERETKEIIIESKKYPDLAPEIEIETTDGPKKYIIEDWNSEMSIQTAIRLAEKYSNNIG